MIYICNVCGKGFDSKQKLGGHKLSHKTYNNEIIVCDICGKECKGNQALNQHKTKVHSPYPSGFNQQRDDLYCQYCNKKFNTLNSLKNHEAWCDLNPNHRSKDIFFSEKYLNRKHVSWNKGLTKETDERIEKQSQTRINNNKLGLYKIYDHSHSERTKEILRQKALSNPYKRKCKKTVEYIKKDGSKVFLDSTYEIKTANILEELGILWERPNSLVWIDKNNRKHNYFPDFYLLDYDIYLDPKNEYCFKVQKEKIDYIKINYKNVYFMHEEDINEHFILSIISN